MAPFKVLKKTETQTACISLCDDSIMRVMLKKGAEIDQSKAQENIKAYISLSMGEKVAYIFYSEDESVIYTEEARRNAKQHEALFPKICVAVIVNSLAQRMIANFYLNFHKPGYPFKVFEKMSDAEAWCLEEIAKENRPNRAASLNSVLF